MARKTDELKNKHNIAYYDAKEVEFGSFDGIEEGEHVRVGLVSLSTPFVK